MKLADILGQEASRLLRVEPFDKWPVKRVVDDAADPPSIGYVFEGCGLQLTCDRHDERVRSVFAERETHGGAVLSEVSFDLCRDEVRKRYGSPVESGKGFSHPILGDFGAWDRFRRSGFTLHVQYGPYPLSAST